MNLKVKIANCNIIKMFKQLWAWTCKHFDKAFYKGGWKQFMWLTSFIIVIGGAGLLASSFFDVKGWRVVELLLDPGSFCNSSDNGGNVLFQLAITLAGAVVFTSLLINAVGNFLERRIDRYRNGGIAYEVDDHILIIGARSMLANLIKTLLGKPENTKRDIVILTSKDAEEVRSYIFSEIPKEKSRNIYVYFGSRTRKETLDKLDAHQSKTIYILGEDDEPAHDSVNMKCYEILKETCRNSRRIIDCFMVLDRLTSIQLFYYKQDNTSSGMLRLTVINSLENVAQRVLVSRFYRDGKLYPSLDRNGLTARDDKFVHFIIVGMSPIGYAMAATAAHVCHFPNFHSKGLRTKITFIHADIKQEMNFFLGRYNALMSLSYWKYVNFENPDLSTSSFPNKRYISPTHDEKGFLDIEWEFLDGGIETPDVRNYLEECALRNDKSEILTIALCDNEPETNASIALFLPEIISEKQIPLLVYQPGGDQILRVVNDSVLFSNIFPFGMKTDAFDIHYHERMRHARRIKYLYDQGENFTKMPKDDELTENWFETQYAFQQSNMYAANSIPFKLRSMTHDKSKEPSKTEIELMARTEHNRWNMERLLMGFRPYEFSERIEFKQILVSENTEVIENLETNLNEAKTKLFKHMDIAPYDELLESSKKYDRAIIRNILKVLQNN